MLAKANVTIGVLTVRYAFLCFSNLAHVFGMQPNQNSNREKFSTSGGIISVGNVGLVYTTRVSRSENQKAQKSLTYRRTPSIVSLLMDCFTSGDFYNN